MITSPAPGLATRRHGVAAPIATAATATLAVGAVAIRGPHVPGIVCPWRALTGLDCPGCGATRSVAALAGGDLLGALDHHLLVPLVAIVLGWAWVSWLASGWRGRALWHPLGWRWAAPLTLVVVATFTVVRNVGGFAAGFLGSDASLG